MSRGYSPKLCQDFQNSLTYEKIDSIWKHFREAGNSLQGRVSRAVQITIDRTSKQQQVRNSKQQTNNSKINYFRDLNLITVHREKMIVAIGMKKWTGLSVIKLIFKISQSVQLSSHQSLSLIKLDVEFCLFADIFYLTDLDQDGCLSLQEIQNMIQRIQKIFWKENSSSKVQSFSLLVENAYKRAQRNYKQILFLLYKNNPSLKNDEGGLITSQQFIESLKGSKDLYEQQRFLPLNLSLAQVIENVANELTIRITEENKDEFCKFRKQLYTILQKGGDQKDIIKYPWITEIVKDDKVVSLLPFQQKIIEKDKKQERVVGKGRGPRAEFKQLFDQKSSDQTLQSYQLKVKKMKETKEDPKFNIKFDKVVRK